MSDVVRECWARSWLYRLALVAAAIWALVRLAVHGVYLAAMLNPTLLGGAGAAEWVNAPRVPIDLELYLDAARRLLAHQDLYPTAARIEVFQYSPVFALAFVPFLWLTPAALVALHSLLHIGAYALLYLAWGRIFGRLDLPIARRSLAWTLPLWLVGSAFWADLGYLNIYIPVALLGTFLIEAVLAERLGAALVWLALILSAKPHWAFPIVVPLVLGRRRFFARLVGLAGALYLALACATLLIVGPAYGWRQYAAYFRFLITLRSQFPWRGPEAGFLGYNHSITQVVVYLLGVSSRALRLATALKALLLVPLAIVGFRVVRNHACRLPLPVDQVGLELAVALYLAAFIWLDMVWEVSLGGALFAYLWAVQPGRVSRALCGIVFIPYALVDLWQVLSLALFGTRVLAPGPYVLTDPSVYTPLTMIAILVFYGGILKRLWQQTAQRHAAPRTVSGEVGLC